MPENRFRGLPYLISGVPMKERRPHKVCFIECSPKLRLWRLCGRCSAALRQMWWRLCGRCSAALRRKRSSVWTHVRGAYVAASAACTSQNGLFRSLTFTVYRLTFVTVCSRLLTIVTTATMQQKENSNSSQQQKVNSKSSQQKFTAAKVQQQKFTAQVHKERERERARGNM